MNDCIYCGRPLSGEHDGWAHAVCEAVVAADNAACQVIDNGRLSKVERRLRKQGRCSWQIRAHGHDGSATYCGREITEHGDEPSIYCLEHECEELGDDEGAAEERNERTLHLLEQAGLGEAI